MYFLLTEMILTHLDSTESLRSKEVFTFLSNRIPGPLKQVDQDLLAVAVGLNVSLDVEMIKSYSSVLFKSNTLKS